MHVQRGTRNITAQLKTFECYEHWESSSCFMQDYELIKSIFHIIKAKNKTKKYATVQDSGPSTFRKCMGKIMQLELESIVLKWCL